MKKLLKHFVLTFAILAIVAFSACSMPEKPNEDKLTFNISESVKTIKEYDTFYLTTDYEGEETVSYVSGNSGVATVDNQGLVTGVSVGETTITVTIKNVSKVCYLTIEEDTSVPVLSLGNVEGETISLNIQDEFDLGAVVKNNGVVVSANLTFESENQQVATVSNVGVVSAVGVGETVINVSGEYRGKPLSAEVAVSVERKVSFNLTIEEDTIYAVAELNGENFVNTTRAVANLVVDSVTITNGFTFESEDQEIATVDESGNVVAKKVGETKIYCYYQLDGEQIYAYKTLTVDYAVVDYNAEVLVEKSEEVTTAIFDELFIDEQTVIKVLDVADTEIEIEISDGVLNEETLKSFTGDRAWRIYNQAYAYNVKVVVADYVIGTADKFKEVMPTLTSEYVILSQNISGVGKYTNNKTNTFTGVFDGRGYTISNVEIANNGIFTYVLGATVKNLAITNAKVGQLSSVFAIQIDGLTLDNIYVKIDSMGYDETNPSGAIGVQIGGVLTVNNSLVIVDGIDANSNAGAIAGAWWGGSVSLSNAYFITEGNPYGKVLIKDTNNKLGKEENDKGSWSYIYASVAAFATERKATDSKINLNDFNDCWEMNTGDHPFFNSDLNTKYSFSNSYNGSYNGGELYMFGKNESVTEYQIPVTVAQTQLKTLLLGGIELSSATFKDGKITVSKTEIAEIANGEYQMVMDFGTKVYKSTVTVADYVVTTETEFKSIFSGTGLITSYVVLANDITFTSSFVGHQGVFSGTLNGKGYALKNLTIPEAGIGLFSEMNGQVKNLAILNVTHNGDGAVVANQSRGLIDNVIITGIAGGHSTLANVMYSGTVSNSIVIVEQNARNVGTSASIVRSMRGTATNCFAVSKTFTTTFNATTGTNWAGTVNNCDIKTSAEDLVALFNGTLPMGFNAYWSIDNNGNVLIGDEIVLATNN
ncbi:MAG: Ig-like domain-containing protein [Clostridia bacterium]|nr:Ig-like domain-containing protein [Clostridia bacterium]